MFGTRRKAEVAPTQLALFERASLKSQVVTARPRDTVRSLQKFGYTYAIVKENILTTNNKAHNNYNLHHLEINSPGQLVLKRDFVMS
jgi:hypothetical protein